MVPTSEKNVKKLADHPLLLVQISFSFDASGHLEFKCKVKIYGDENNVKNIRKETEEYS